MLGADHPQTGDRSSGAWALYACRAGDYAVSRTPDRALDRDRRAQLRRGSLRTATAVNVLGVLEETQGHLDEAQRHYERVLAIRRELLAPTIRWSRTRSPT